MRWNISGIQRGMLQELREILPTSLTTPTLPGSAQSELWEPRDTLLSQCYLAGTEGAWGSGVKPTLWLLLHHLTLGWWCLVQATAECRGGPCVGTPQAG